MALYTRHLQISSKILTLTSRFVFRTASSNSVTRNKIVITDDGSTFVIWHPKQDFPYECTKALPQVNLEEQDTVLKTQFSSELLAILNKKKPDQARLELMNITHTTKHRWFPKCRDKKRKPIPEDREYL